MILGAHRSTAGGLWNAAESGRAIGCDAIQIFTRQPQRWAHRPIEDAEADRFRQACADNNISCVVAHDIYLTNLASPNDELRQKSLDSCIDELGRCQKLGIPYLVMHCGSHEGCEEEVGIRRFSEAVQQALDTGNGPDVKILLETTAGQGKALGWTFEQLARLLEGINRSQSTGACLDTCHVFAAGYDISTAEGYSETMHKFDKVIGLNLLHAVHCNDSKKALGSRRDRHENIGEGEIGEEAFRQLVNDSRLADIPILLETPDLERHEEDLKKLRSFML
ncbi:MAG: deoxyribonuclease IV [Armatimonadetes bacterium]|nr:deoxyribonuclease IV [Armatimonadota bacterium]